MEFSSDRASDLLSLPNEVLRKVLRCDGIDHFALCRLSQVCRRLRLLISDDELWNLKAKRRWRVWRSGERMPRLSSHDHLEISAVIEWKKLSKERHGCENKIREVLNEVAEDYLLLDKNNGLIDDSSLLPLREMYESQDFVMESLREIADGTSIQPNLSHKFYAPSAYSYLKWVQLRDSFPSIFESNMDSSVELMAPIAIWIDQWMNPLEDLEYFDYSGEFERLAARANQGLGEGASRWEIICSIDRVMFQEEGYRVNNNFYLHSNSYLHKVIKSKRGIYISLSVIFQAVASRLGLRLLPVSFPGYFVLSYEEADAVAGGARKQFLTFVEGDKVRKMSDMELRPAASLFDEEILAKLSSVRIVSSRMLANILMNLIHQLPSPRIDANLSFIKCLEAYDLFDFLRDSRVRDASILAKEILNYNIDQKTYIYSSERTKQLLEERDCLFDKKERVKELSRRYLNCDESVLSQAYPIGLIARLKVGSTPCFGVIYDWKTHTHHEQESLQPIPTSIVYSLLADGDRFLKCAASEFNPCLSQNEARPVSHYLVGKYFSCFNGCYYKPIPPLQHIYSDHEVRIKSLSSDIN